jgi:hypothetical protein
MSENAVPQHGIFFAFPLSPEVCGYNATKNADLCGRELTKSLEIAQSWTQKDVI